MIGDFFGVSPIGFRGSSTLDRLMILADDLDSPNVLPGGGSILTLTEPGPIGIFSSSLTSVQQLQTLFRAGGPIPGLTLQGTVNDNATLSTVNTISQIQSQLGATGLGYDIILIQPPPGSYTAGAHSVFQARNTIPGSTVFNSAGSGALIQGGLYTPNDRFFAQGFVQYDATASGNSVAINSTGAGLQHAGTLTDPGHIFFNAGLGCWLYRSNAKSGLTGIVPTAEVHQTSSTQPGDLVSAGPFQVGNFNGSTSITSVVAGTTFEFGRRSQLTAGYATPIGGGSDRQYDGAFQFNFNRLLGP